MKRTAFWAACYLVCMAAISAAQPPAPTFFARRDYLGVVVPYVAAADVDGDGIPDLIASDGGYIKVLPGNGDGTFRPGPNTNTVMLAAGAFVAADINGDGELDLILVGGLTGIAVPQGIAVCLGNGDGTFQRGVFYQAGTESVLDGLVRGDFNGDGIPDVATSGDSGVWLFTGRPDGTFNTGVLAARLASWGSLAATDFNGDHKLDLVVTLPVAGTKGSGAGFAVLLGNGDGTFQPPETFAQPKKSAAVAVGDLNHDGHPDIALASTYSSDYVYVYFGDGAGGFSGPSYVHLPASATAIAIGDVNGDGIPDLVSPGVYIALGNGNGTFKKPVHYTIETFLGICYVVLADLRNNGLTDILATSANAISVLLSQGKGRYEDGKWTAVPGGAGCGAAADYNRDGKPDLAVNTPQGVSILLGTGKPGSPFTAGPTIALSGAGCLVTGDLNGDGIPDLLVPTATAVVAYLGNGDGTFTQKGTTATPTEGYLALGDFNHDGKLDFATSGNLLALGNGDGTFRTPIPFVSSPPTGGFSNIAAGDLNGDGWLDLVLTNANIPYSPLYVLLNNQHGGFNRVKASFGQLTIQAALADLNGDRKLDLVLAYLAGGVQVYLGNGKGGFTLSGALVNPLGSPPLIAVADVNGDGIPDISLVAGDSVGLFLSNGDGTFQVPLYIGAGPAPGDILAENLHGQPAWAGLPDIVAPDLSGGVMVLFNKTK